MKYIESLTDFPKEAHIGVLVFESIHIPGDQRSIDYPGHGYPEHWEPVVKYISMTEPEFAQWAIDNTNRKYVVFRSEPLRVITKTTINLSK